MSYYQNKKKRLIINKEINLSWNQTACTCTQSSIPTVLCVSSGMNELITTRGVGSVCVNVRSLPESSRLTAPSESSVWTAPETSFVVSASALTCAAQPLQSLFTLEEMDPVAPFRAKCDRLNRWPLMQKDSVVLNSLSFWWHCKQGQV